MDKETQNRVDNVVIKAKELMNQDPYLKFGKAVEKAKEALGYVRPITRNQDC